jgi:hypothetical protein
MWRVAVRVAEALVGAVAAGALIAKQVNLWNPQTTIPLWVALAIVTLQAVGLPLRSAINQFRAARSAEFREAARTALSTALMRLSALPGIEVRDIGLNAFMVQREVDPPWRRHLHRVAKVRLSYLPRAPAFSRFVMIRPVQTTRPRSGEHCCFCNGQGPQGRPQRSGHRPDNERTPGLCQMPTVRAEEEA